VEPEPKTQQDAAQAPAPMAPAPTPNLMFNIGGLSKNVIHLKQFLTFPIHFHDNSTHKKSEEKKIYPTVSTCLLFCVQYALLIDGNNVWEEEIQFVYETNLISQRE
jgi:hypothetical protein